MLVSARRWVSELALVAALSVASVACSRHAEAPAIAAAAPAGPLQPAPRDAALEPRDAAPEVAIAAGPGSAEPPRAHANRAAAQPPGATGGFMVEGSIGRADAETVLRGARADLDACYQKALGKNPALAGQATFRLSIDNRGRVPMAEVLRSTLGGGDPEPCMVEALRDLQFPPSATGGESTVSFPMTFGR